MRRRVEISPGFWKEFKERGFAVHKETGGRYIPYYQNFTIQKATDKMYKISDPSKKSFSMTVVEPSVFFKTVKKIESIVKYKLFF